MEKILVIGATGMLGYPVAKKLNEEGFQVKAFTRNPEKAKKLFDDDFEIVRGSVEDTVSLKEALSDCQGVHINLKGGPKDKDYMRIEYGGTVNIINAAKIRNVRRLTYLSGISAYKEKLWFVPSKVKFMAEEAILNSNINYSIFKATWFMESLKLFARGKNITVIGEQTNPIHWIAAEDYARMVANAYKSDNAINKKFIVKGQEAYTMKQAAEIYTEIVNPDMKVKTMPLWFAKFLGIISFDSKLKDVVRLMEFFNKTIEKGEPEETFEILGTPEITLKDWAEKQK